MAKVDTIQEQMMENMGEKKHQKETLKAKTLKQIMVSIGLSVETALLRKKIRELEDRLGRVSKLKWEKKKKSLETLAE